MPVRYDIAGAVPQISGGAAIDPLNYMAQIRQQELADAQMQQMAMRGYYQDLAAQRAGEASLRAGQASERQAAESDVRIQAEKEKLLADKLHRTFSALGPKATQEDFLKAAGKFQKDDPEFTDWLRSQQWNEDLYRRLTLSPKEQVETQDKWSPVRGSKQEIEYYANQTGTKVLSPEQYKAMVQGSAAPVETSRGQAGAFAPAPEGAFGGVPMSAVKQGFSKAESGGDYAAVGPAVKRKDGVDHAYGKYQVMGANIPSWTKQALGKSLTVQEFLADPEAQEKVFEDQFTRNFKRYGTVEDAASVWFSGRPLAQATKAGARDVNISAPEYVQRVVGGMGPVQNAPTVPLTGEMPSLRGVPVNAFTPMAAPINAMAAPSAAAQQQSPALPPVTAAPAKRAVPPSLIAAPEEIKQRQEKFIADAPLGQSAKYRGKVDLENMLTNFANELEYLKEQDAIPSTSNTAARNAEISSGASWLGQAYGRFTGTPAQSTRDAIDSIRQNLVSVLARATGKNAQELNSNFDVKNAIKALGDPKATIESTRATLNNINKTFGTNVDIGGSAAKSESRRQIEASKAAPAIPEAVGIDPAAIKMLRDNPDTAAAFDAHFGTPGLAAKILGR